MTKYVMYHKYFNYYKTSLATGNHFNLFSFLVFRFLFFFDYYFSFTFLSISNFLSVTFLLSLFSFLLTLFQFYFISFCFFCLLLFSFFAAVNYLLYVSPNVEKIRLLQYRRCNGTGLLNTLEERLCPIHPSKTPSVSKKRYIFHPQIHWGILNNFRIIFLLFSICPLQVLLSIKQVF